MMNIITFIEKTYCYDYININININIIVIIIIIINVIEKSLTRVFEFSTEFFSEFSTD